MKSISYLLVTIAFIAVNTSCNKISYRKTSSGLLYKIIPSKSKDPIVKTGDWIKLNFIQKINDDSVLQSSYGKMPVYQQIMAPDPSNPNTKYNPAEVFPLLKKGDSVVVIMYVDSLVKPGMQMPPFFKKGDKLNLYFRVIDVFRNDSLKQADERIEMERDAPRAQKERSEQMEKMQKQMEERQKEINAQKAKELEEVEKSGEAQKERDAMEAYLSSKHITAQKTGKGTYVAIKEPGTGAQAIDGKYLTVKYTGKTLTDGKEFQSNTYSFQLGKGAVLEGWDEGLLLFKEGGKGTLYIPGFRAYGKNPPPQSPFKPNEPLIFDIELISVSDTPPPQAEPQPGQ